MPESAPATILFVDDDESNRDAFTWFLQRAGFRVQAAASGGEALRRAADRPDLVILDVNLPDMSGFEVCRRLKHAPATASVPVLHLSAVHVSGADQKQGLEGGADAYLTKPVEPDVLVAHVQALLRARQAEEEARALAR